jgi:hypothetical protein
VPDSPALQRFLESLDATHTVWRDDFDLGALMYLGHEERLQAESVLLDWLAKYPDDDRVAPALVEVKSERGAEALRQAVARQQGTSGIRFAKALATLDASFDPVPHYLSVLAKAVSMGERSLAASELAGRSEAHVVAALRAALRDRDDVVRVSAFDALIESLHLRPLHNPVYSPLREIGQLLLCDRRSVWQEAAQKMERIVDGCIAGQKPIALGLHDRPKEPNAVIDAFLERLGDGNEPSRDFERLDTLTGAARRFVESVLLYHLRNDDPRIPRALARIGTARALAPLEEVSRESRPRSAADIARAIEKVRARTREDGLAPAAAPGQDD